MAEPTDLTDQFVFLVDAVTLENAERIKARGFELIRERISGEVPSDTPIEVDLGGLQHANSVTVALLAAWYRAATNSGGSIVFMNLSPELRKIVAFSGLAEILPVQS